MMDRLPNLKFVAVSRGGPVNIDMKAARERGITRRQHAGPQCQCGCRIHHRRDPRRDAQHHAGHDALRRGEWRGDLYRADLDGAGTLRNDGRPHRLRRGSAGASSSS
jgi:D-3-phosphoglycerate dehydrogenase / 2-oxoglutarate reductase